MVWQTGANASEPIVQGVHTSVGCPSWTTVVFTNENEIYHQIK
jgi:hypothetical protein